MIDLRLNFTSPLVFLLVIRTFAKSPFSIASRTERTVAVFVARNLGATVLEANEAVLAIF